MTSITSKSAVRDEVFRRLKGLTELDRQEASAAIRRNLETWPTFRSAGRIALFAGLASEPDLLSLLELRNGDRANDGKTFCFPRVNGDTLEMFSIRDPGELISGSFGILEPDPQKARRIDAKSIDLVLAPGVAFGLGGERVGRGGGYFDRFLPTLGRKARIAGICLECQLFRSLPVEPHDVSVGYLVSETGVRTVGV